jgi:hypothetical protein
MNVVGHASRAGSEQFNDQLSQQRATYIKERLEAYRESWPPATARRYLPAKPGPREALPQAERVAQVARGRFF